MKVIYHTKSGLSPILYLVAIIFLGLFISHPTSATTSYLNVSSGAGTKLSFGKVRPDDTGVSATTSDTLTINTNCTAGYSVYVSAQSDKGTDLVNKNPRATVNNTIATSSAAIGSATALANNTWGISATEGDTYVGLPTYANALNTPLTIMSDVAEQTTVPIYYGLKVDTTLAPGIYSGDILYTVLSNPACASYIIHFNSNGGTGDMNNQTVPVGTAVSLDTNAFTRSGYVFIGWSDSATGKTGTAVNGVGTEADVDYADSQSVTDIASFGTTKELYAIWTTISGDMQSWSGNECSALSEGQQIYLQDTRDGRAYAIKRLPDGKCWMVQNLALGMNATTTGLTLTPTDTNIDNGTTYYLPPAGKQGSGTIDQPSTLTATDTANFTGDSSTDQHAKTQFRTKDSSVTNDSDTGYYNFYTATLGFSYWGDGKTSGSSTRDICPKGWRLPKTTDRGETVSTTGLANDFTNLTLTYSTSDWHGNATRSYYYTIDSIAHEGIHTGVATNGNNYAGFSYSGNWHGMDSSTSNVGSYGYYWSASVQDPAFSYSIFFDSSDVSPQHYSDKGLGLAIRCIVKESTMQDFDASTSLPNVGDQMKLEDTRDGKMYTVKRLPDGKVWMMQNLTIGSDGAKTLTSTDTNIDDGKIYYLPPAGKQGSSTIDNSSTLTATDTADFTYDSSTDQHAKTQFRTKDTSITNDSDTGYYNFYTATLGFSYYQDGKNSGSSTRDICPKGWRLPKTPNTTTEQVSSVGSDNDFTYLVRQYSISNWSGSLGGYNYYTTNSTARNSMYLSAASPLATSTQNNYAGFSYAGYWNGTNTSASDVGSYGYYRSSSVYGTDYGYRLYFGSSGIYPQYYGSKSRGVAVRCVAKEPTPTMQNFDASTSLPNVGDQMELEDTRDGKMYTVKRLPDGKVWMVQNLALGMNATTTGLTLTPADTNIDNNTTYYLPPAGKQGSSTIDQSSTLTATTTANFSFSTGIDNRAKTQFRTKDSSITNDSDTGYYNFYTATLGYSYSYDGKTSGSSTRDICPKGWRLPKTTDNGTTVSTTGTANDFTNLVRQYSTSDWSGTTTDYLYNTTNSTARTGIHTGAAFPLATSTQNNYAGFSYAGYYDHTSWYDIGSRGIYLSTSICDDTRFDGGCGHVLYFDSSGSGIYPQTHSDKSFGYAVRCVSN